VLACATTGRDLNHRPEAAFPRYPRNGGGQVGASLDIDFLASMSRPRRHDRHSPVNTEICHAFNGMPAPSGSAFAPRRGKLSRLLNLGQLRFFGTAFLVQSEPASAAHAPGGTLPWSQRAGLALAGAAREAKLS
jgi:hypothetical protein